MKEYKLKKNQQNKITLLRHVAMPENVDYGEASIALKCTGVEFPEDIKVRNRTKQDTESETVLHLELADVPFAVGYELDAKYDPKSDIDVAGNLRVRSQVNGEEGLTAEKESWLEQARVERSTLEGTPNGQMLMDVYNLHKDAYNKAFESYAFCEKWKEGGITEEMSRDTYDAIQNGKVINDENKQYVNADTGVGVTYNVHAFDEQASLQLTLLMMGPEINPEGPGHISEDELLAAATAITDFNNAVYDNTGNNSDNTVPMTKNDVYKKVNNPKANTLRATQNKDPYEEINYYYDRLKNHRNGLLKAEKDKYGHEEFFRKLLSEKMQRSDDAGIVLYEGKFSGMIPEGLKVDILIERDGNEVKDIKVLEIDMPEPDIDVDSEQWALEYREQLEEKIQDVSFIRQNVTNILREGLGQSVRGEVAKHEDFRI